MTTRRRLLGALAAGCASLAGEETGAAQTPAKQQQGPLVAVTDCPQAEDWLTRIGVTFQKRSGNGLGALPIEGPKVLILPLEAVRTPGAVMNLQVFLSKGGRIAAFNWGTLLPPGETQPLHELIPSLGVRAIGWRDASGQEITCLTSGAGLYPYGGSTTSLTRCMTTVLEPVGARTIARFTEDLSGRGRTGLIFQRAGVTYCGANLFRSGDRTDARELFFYILQRAAPSWGPMWQARDRVRSASVAQAELVAQTGFEGVRGETGPIVNGLADARALLGAGQAARATAAADKARQVAEQLIARLKAPITPDEDSDQ